MVGAAVLAAAHAELTKILTLSRVWIVTGIVLAFHVLILLQPAELFADAVANMAPDGTIEVFSGRPQPATEAVLGLLVASSFQVGLFLPVLATVIAGQEFRAQQIGLTALAVPRTARLLGAKLLATTAYVLAVAVVIAALSTAAMYRAVKNWDPALLLTQEAFLGHGRFIAFAVLYSLTGFAITMVARSTLTGIVVTVALVVVTMTQVLARPAPYLDALLPLSAARNLLLDPAMNDLSAGRTSGLLVLSGWAVATAAAAAVTLHRRDAR
ncbi:hypothetical protein P9869_14145 [Streptomyces ossamyceticus]|nr:hypothetical protein [Streptomyces ossamyceticus]